MLFPCVTPVKNTNSLLWIIRKRIAHKVVNFVIPLQIMVQLHLEYSIVNSIPHLKKDYSTAEKHEKGKGVPSPPSTSEHANEKVSA